MKKIFLFSLLLISLSGFSQIKMGDFPLLLGRGDSVKVPVLLSLGGGLYSNRDMYGHDLAYGKVDSVIISNDSVYEINSGRKRFRWMRTGGTGNGTITKDTAIWGKVLGNINLQSDLIAMFNTKQNAITLGTISQYLRGNLTLGTLQTDVLAFTDPRYAALLHTHTSADISDFTGAVRAQFTQGTGINIAAGVISWTGSSGTGLIGHINAPLSLSGDTLKLLSVGSSIITGTKDHNYISDLNTTVLGYFSGIAPVLYNNGTGAFSLDTANAPSGIATKGRLLKGLDSVHTLSTYTKGYGLNLSANQFSADSIALASRLRLYKTIDSMNQVNLQVLVAKDSLNQYPIWYFPPLHVAYDSLHGNKIDSVWIDVGDTGKAGVVIPFDFKRFDFASNKTDTALSVQNFILISKKLDGTTIQTALPQYFASMGLLLTATNFSLDTTLSGTKASLLKSLDSVKIKAPSGNIIYGLSGTGTTNSGGLNFDGNALTLQSAFAELFLRNTGTNGRTFRLISGSTGSYTYGGGFEIIDQKASRLDLAIDSNGVWVDPNLSGTGTRMVVADPVGALSTQAIPSGGSPSLTSTYIGVGNGVLTGYPDFIWDETNKILQLGTTATGQITPTPDVIDITGTYSNSNGNNLKFKLFHNTLATYGIGVSSNGSNAQMDFVVGDALADFAFYSGASPSLIMKLTNAGILQVGSGDETNMPAGSSFNSIYSYASNGTQLAGAFRANQTASNTGSIQAVEGYTKTSNASGNVALSIGAIGNAEHAGAGTIAEMRGVQGGVVIRSGGTVTSAYAGYFAPVNIITGTTTVTNSYGLYVGDHTPGSGTITNKYNIYAHDGNGINYFAGNTQLNHLGGNGSTPSVSVGSSVTGTVSVVGNDIGGTVTLVVTSSTSLSTLAELFTLTFASAYSSTPNVVFSPANAAAIGNTTTCYVKGTSTAGFSVATANSIASLPVTTYIWTYKVSN